MKKSFSLSTVVRIVLCIVAVFTIFWFELPPLNLRSKDFWIFLIISAAVCFVIMSFGWLCDFLKGIKEDPLESRSAVKSLGKPAKVLLICIGAVVAFILVASLVGSQVFNASRYENILTLEDGDFNVDVAELEMSQIPVVDRDTASRLGQRKLGEMSDLVSQFVIEEDYTQINYHGVPTRVTPLAYGDIIKWLGNRAEGIPAYIMVDMVSQETSLVRLDNGIRYSNSEYFMRYLPRYLRFKYPTKIFDNISFEIDEEGTPYWVASTVDYRIALWSGRDVGGAVLVNAVTGESEYYDFEDIPAWVDQVFDSEMIIDQLTYNGKYRSGFINSIFGQKGVLQPTAGYNYIAVGDDVYLYTGMTSVMSDESNVGFVLVNLRTKAARFYSIPGAEEYSAMSSAEGQVQNLGYVSTFPLLLNVSNRPTYFMSLKDGAGLVKMYAFVDVANYQVVGTGNTIDEARKNYISKLRVEDQEVVDKEEISVEGTVEAVGSAVLDGNTVYFIRLTSGEEVYPVPIKLSDSLPFVQPGDSVSLTLAGAEVTAFQLK